MLFLVTESVQLTRAVLLVNAECYTAWSARYEVTVSLVGKGAMTPSEGTQETNLLDPKMSHSGKIGPQKVQNTKP